MKKEEKIYFTSKYSNVNLKTEYPSHNPQLILGFSKKKESLGYERYSNNLFEFEDYTQVMERQKNIKILLKELQNIGVNSEITTLISEKILKTNNILREEASKELSYESIKCFTLFLININLINFGNIIPSPDSFIQIKFKKNSNKLLISFLPKYEIDFAFLENSDGKDNIVSGNMSLKNFMVNYLFKLNTLWDIIHHDTP